MEPISSTNDHCTVSQCPLLIDLVLIKISTYLDWESLKNGLEVCSVWNEALKPQFKKRSELNVKLNTPNSTTEFLLQFSSPNSTVIPAVHLTPGDIPTFHLMSEWLSCFSHPLTHLTLGSEEDDVPSFQLNPQVLHSILRRWCPNLRNLTIINAELQLENDFTITSLCSLVTIPAFTLAELVIKTTRVDFESSLSRNLCSIGEEVLKYVLDVKSLTLHFNQRASDFYIDEHKCSCTKVLQNVVELSLKKNARIREHYYKQRSILVGSMIFPNLKRMLVQQTGFYLAIALNSDDGDSVRFPELEELDISVDEFSPRIFQEVPKLRKLIINHIDVYILPSLELSYKCPNLRTIEFTGSQDFSQRNIDFEFVGHSNVQELKVSLKEMNYEGIREYFPNLKILDVDLTGRSFHLGMQIIIDHPSIQELTFLENNVKEEFDTAMELYFYDLLLGFQKLHIKTLNSRMYRGTNLLNILTQQVLRVSNASVPLRLTSFTLEGFNVCCKQYDEMKHNVPFHMLITKKIRVKRTYQ